MRVLPCLLGCIPRESGDGVRIRPWHPQTLEFWRDAFRSEMESEYVQVDVHGLFILAELVDQFWHHPTPTRAAEIRLQRQCYGLTPLDRRRLQWELETAEAAKPAARPTTPVSPVPGQQEAPRPDPRGVLSMVKKA